MLFVLVANIDNTTEELQNNKIFETFNGENNKSNFSHIVGRFLFVKQTALRDEPVCKCNASERDRATHDQTQLFLLVEPSQFGQKQLSVPQRWCVAFEDWSICGQPVLKNGSTVLLLIQLRANQQIRYPAWYCGLIFQGNVHLYFSDSS